MKNKDLTLLTSQDLQDIFSIIHIANCHHSLSEMRTRVGRSLREIFDASGIAFFLGDRDLKAIDNANLAGIDVDLHYLNQWVKYFCHDDPFQQRPLSRSPVCKVDDLLPYHSWVNLRIYNEFYRPQNIHYKLSISLRSYNKVLGLIGIFRTREQQDFSCREMAKARILAPHLTTALENVFEDSSFRFVVHLLDFSETCEGEEETLRDEYQLTKREVDIIRCVCQGLTNDEIGKKLYISRFTVETHLKNIFDKTKVKHRAGLAGLLQSF